MLFPVPTGPSAFQGATATYVILGLWRGPRQFLEVPVILIEPTLGRMCYWAFVDGRGTRLAAGGTPPVGAGRSSCIGLQILVPSARR